MSFLIALVEFVIGFAVDMVAGAALDLLLNVLGLAG